MKKSIVFVVAVSFCFQVGAQETEPNSNSDKSTDKTGTNPINFTHDFRIYNEFQWLNTDGDGESNTTTMEYRQPFAGGKLQFRMRLRGVWTEADVNDDGIDDLDSSGMGAADFRILHVPYVNMAKKRALAIGFETFLPTGNAIVGSENLSFGPQIFGVFFLPFGIKDSLIAPAYQHKFSVWNESESSHVNQSLFDLFFLKTTSDKQKWMMINPQYVIDHVSQTNFGFIDIELGTMLDKYFGTKGHSAYIRPSLGIGEDHPTDGAIELGYKIVW
jgi:hypothetical protein